MRPGACSSTGLYPKCASGLVEATPRGESLSAGHDRQHRYPQRYTGACRHSEFPRHIGIVDDTAEERLAEGNVTHDGYINNPGGLAGVWAVENSRDAIFDAIQNRSTFATSGPRIKPRFYAGWDFQDDLCDDTNRVRIAGTSGVSMGQVLRPKPGAMPRFMVQADADDGGLKAGLQRIQIIKGWVDEKGKTHHAIYDVAAMAKPAQI